MAGIFLVIYPALVNRNYFTRRCR